MNQNYYNAGKAASRLSQLLSDMLHDEVFDFTTLLHMAQMAGLETSGAKNDIRVLRKWADQHVPHSEDKFVIVNVNDQINWVREDDGQWFRIPGDDPHTYPSLDQLAYYPMSDPDFSATVTPYRLVPLTVPEQQELDKLVARYISEEED